MNGSDFYHYRAKLIRIHDGDTVWLDIDFGDYIRRAHSIRLYGINCPELAEEGGREAKRFVVDWFAKHTNTAGYVGIRTELDRTEKYGRLLGRIYDIASEEVLNDALLESGNAVPYL